MDTENQLALIESRGPPTQDEINRITKEHKAVAQAGRSMLPRAMAIGEWFIAQRRDVPEGEWQDWVKCWFPTISFRTVRMYVQLGTHRQFLEAKFHLNGNDIAAREADFERLTSIKEAEQAIRNLHKKPSKRDKKAIEIEATVCQSNGQHGVAERPIQLSPSDEKKLEEPVCDPNNDPKIVLSKQVAAYVDLYVKTAQTLQSIKEWIKLAQINSPDILYAVQLGCRDHPEMEELALIEVKKKHRSKKAA